MKFVPMSSRLCDHVFVPDSMKLTSIREPGQSEKSEKKMMRRERKSNISPTSRCQSQQIDWMNNGDSFTTHLGNTTRVVIVLSNVATRHPTTNLKNNKKKSESSILSSTLLNAPGMSFDF